MSSSSLLTLTEANSDQLTNLMSESFSPVLFRSLVSHWPAVKAGKQSNQHLQQYLNGFAINKPLAMFEGPPSINGRPFYNDDFSGLNFRRCFYPMDTFFAKLNAASQTSEKPLLYMGSTNAKSAFPGYEQHNFLDFGQENRLTNLWIGNQSCIATHFDFPENLACCIAGQRRVTLFPPDQLENLYIGPLDITPAGQPISLVDSRNPDFERFPRYKQALSKAIEVILSPGDALFIPSMWWHQVTATSSFNVLHNYWWKKTPAYLPSPVNALNSALLAIKSLPKEQKVIWQALLHYYVFDDAEVSHIPQHILGPLGQIDELQARKLRAQLLNALNH